MILWTSFMVIVQCVTPDVSTWDHKSRFSISINISIWYVMSFGLYHDLSDHSNHSHQSFHGINANVVIDLVIGHYGYKSSFRAKKSIINCSLLARLLTKKIPIQQFAVLPLCCFLLHCADASPLQPGQRCKEASSTTSTVVLFFSLPDCTDFWAVNVHRLCNWKCSECQYAQLGRLCYQLGCALAHLRNKHSLVLMWLA